MRYYDFIPKAVALKQFQKWRKDINAAAEKSRAEFQEVFSKALEKAGKGDAIMLDVVGYFYSRGIDDMLQEDYLKYMYYEFLAAAKGNIFAIEKLQFFLEYTYEQIIEDKAYDQIALIKQISEYNYVAIIGQAICEAIVDKLDLDAEALSKARDAHAPYKSETFRDLRKTVDSIVPAAIEILKVKD